MQGYENYGMMQLLAAAGCIAAVVLCFVAALVYFRYKNKKFLMRRIRNSWGKIPERKYDPTEFDVISHYYVNRETDRFQIDDITWNDLEMDQIFQLLNHTNSFLGESFLYYQLRTPALKKEELEEFESMVSWFQSHTKEREKMEYFFAQVGKTGRNSIFDYIYNLKDAYSGSLWVHFGFIAMILASIILLFINPQPGILALLTSMGISIGTYEHYKRPIAPYIISCVALQKILLSAEEMAKMDIPVLDGKRELLQRNTADFKKLRRNMALLILSEQQGGLVEGIINYINNCFHLDLIQFKTVVKEMSARLEGFEEIVETIGKMEAAIAVASFRTWHPYASVPVLRDDNVFFHSEDMVHPLLDQPVPNSISTEKCILLTGSNASGKSTFLKTAAVTALLAQTIHTVTAASYEGCCFRIFTSMALRDDLAGEESYFMVEIRSLKRILDRIQGEVPVLCCVDEVLRGTNTIERIAASSKILESMAEKRVICFAATHDIELTYLLEGIFRNCHFEEEVTEEDIKFDYKCKEGRATTRNAIRLLKLMGYEDGIIQAAEKTADLLSERELVNKVNENFSKHE